MLSRHLIYILLYNNKLSVIKSNCNHTSPSRLHALIQQVSIYCGHVIDIYSDNNPRFLEQSLNWAHDENVCNVVSEFLDVSMIYLAFALEHLLLT